MRRPLPLLQRSRPSCASAAHPCALALLLVLPLAGHLPNAGSLSGTLAANESRIETIASTAALNTDAAEVGPSAAAVHSAAAQHDAPAGKPYPLTPERRALLNTIRYAEGTWRNGELEGYRVIYGGSLFSSFQRHPETAVVGNYVSAAAGAYQFLPATWKAAARELNLPDFSPGSQDQAALHLVHRRGALKRFDQQGLTDEVLARLAPEWASLPSSGGGSFYGQPVHSAASLQAFYRQDLERQRRIAAGASLRARITTAGLDGA